MDINWCNINSCKENKSRKKFKNHEKIHPKNYIFEIFHPVSKSTVENFRW